MHAAQRDFVFDFGGGQAGRAFAHDERVDGVGFGVAGGVLIAANIDIVMAWIEAIFGFQVLPKGIYFIDRLPSDLRAVDVTQIGLMALILSLLATLYPSWRASRLEPAEALRYE